eukprot:COSAG05_NODE_634_length_8193_cov_7.035083_5_plen_114_part_00
MLQKDKQVLRYTPRTVSFSVVPMIMHAYGTHEHSNDRCSLGHRCLLQAFFTYTLTEKDSMTSYEHPPSKDIYILVQQHQAQQIYLGKAGSPMKIVTELFHSPATNAAAAAAAA